MILINGLIEYNQRCELVPLEKGRMRLKYKENDKEHIADLMICGGQAFLIQGSTINKITDKVENSSVQELTQATLQQKGKKFVEIQPRIFELLRKELGDYEIVI